MWRILGGTGKSRRSSFDSGPKRTFQQGYWLGGNLSYKKDRLVLGRGKSLSSKRKSPSHTGSAIRICGHEQEKGGFNHKTWCRCNGGKGTEGTHKRKYPLPASAWIRITKKVGVFSATWGSKWAAKNLRGEERDVSGYTYLVFRKN